MAKKEHYTTLLEPGKVYHIYNRTVNDEPLFYSDENRLYFLKRYDFFLSDYVDTYAWCLMKNHFHLMIRVKDNFSRKIDKLINAEPSNQTEPFNTASSAERLTNLNTQNKIVSNQFRKLFQGYTLAINKQQKRIGTLFQTPFKRSEVNDEKYFCNLIYYIHVNPQHHEIVKDFRNFKWTSFETIFRETPTKLNRGVVLNYFGGKEEFIGFHNRKQDTLNEDWIIE
jgi:REP element-mobilizing transposase RayT